MIRAIATLSPSRGAELEGLADASGA